MIRRTVTAVLWFGAGWAGGAVLAFATDGPALLAPVLALAAGGFVAWDPFGKLWGPKPDRRAIRRRIADLERVDPSEPTSAPERAPELARD